jgi:hypothetical protein
VKRTWLNALASAFLRRGEPNVLSPEQERRLQIFESDYGRMGGWHVEHNGFRIAVLSDPQFEDMFWDSYAIEPLSTDDHERCRLLESEEFWLEEEFTYRSRQFDEIAENAFPALTPFISPGRINMRGLYLTIDPPTKQEERLLQQRLRARKAE